MKFEIEVGTGTCSALGCVVWNHCNRTGATRRARSLECYQGIPWLPYSSDAGTAVWLQQSLDTRLTEGHYMVGYQSFSWSECLEVYTVYTSCFSQSIYISGFVLSIGALNLRSNSWQKKINQRVYLDPCFSQCATVKWHSKFFYSHQELLKMSWHFCLFFWCSLG